VDNPNYRTASLSREITKTLIQLTHFEDNRRRRLEGARRLLALGLTPSSLQVAPDIALFRIPLFVRRREQVLAHFARRGLQLDYIYDPPLDRYATAALSDRFPSPEAALAWSRDVLPVDPLRADQFLSMLERSSGILSPAAHSAG